MGAIFTYCLSYLDTLPHSIVVENIVLYQIKIARYKEMDIQEAETVNIFNCIMYYVGF